MKKVTVLVSMLLVIAFVMAGCSGGSATKSPSTTANAPMSTVPSSITISTLPSVTTLSGSLKWPSAMPADVPIFTYGTITGSNNNVMGGVQATFGNVTANASASYQTDLTNAGWNVYNVAPDGSEIDADKGARGVTVMFTSNGTKAAVTYNATSGEGG